MSMLESLRNGVNVWDPYLLVCIVLLVVCFVVPFHKKRKIKKQIQDLQTMLRKCRRRNSSECVIFLWMDESRMLRLLILLVCIFCITRRNISTMSARANRSSIGSMPILPVTGMGMCMQTTNAEIPFPFERSNWRVADAKHSTSWNGMQS